MANHACFKNILFKIIDFIYKSIDLVMLTGNIFFFYTKYNTDIFNYSF